MERHGKNTEREELKEAIFQSWLCTLGRTPNLGMHGADPRCPRKHSEKSTKSSIVAQVPDLQIQYGILTGQIQTGLQRLAEQERRGAVTADSVDTERKMRGHDTHVYAHKFDEII